MVPLSPSPSASDLERVAPEDPDRAGNRLPDLQAPLAGHDGPTRASNDDNNEKKKQSHDAAPSPPSEMLTRVVTNRTQQPGGASLRPTRSYTDGHSYVKEPKAEDDTEGGQDVEQQGLELREKAFQVGWDGAGDPMNSKNMKPGRKWMIVFVLAFGALCVTCTSSLYTITYGQYIPTGRQPPSR